MDFESKVIRCPQCRQKLVEFHGDKLVLKSRFAILGTEKSVVRCSRCKSEVPVSLRIAL